MLTTKGLSKSFGGFYAVKRLDLTVSEGTIHGMIGPNGAGKTTVFNLVSGALEADEGRILYNSTDITGMKAFEIATMGVSRTYQQPRIMPRLSCVENVMAGMYISTKLDFLGTYLRAPFTAGKQETQIRNRAMELLDFVGMSGSGDRMAKDLVWAECHLVEIARALIMEPKLLMLDEPTSGMGDEEIEAIKKLVFSIKAQGITIFLIAHDIKLVTEVSDILTAISFGEKIAEGNPKDVVADREVVKAYLGTEDENE